LKDIQKEQDYRGVMIQEVGVSGVQTPINVVSKSGAFVSTVAFLSMGVELAADVKGTHMSRFLEALQDQGSVLDSTNPTELAKDICDRLKSVTCKVQYEFPYFVERNAPVSGKPSLVDYQVKFISSIKNGQIEPTHFEVTVPIATLCPCSKEISLYGAHNQRGYVVLEVFLKESAYLHFEALIDMIETCGSAPLINLLKRTDEKFVTEQAYENPVFVEDVVRNVAVKIKEAQEVAEYAIRVTNHESIHTHNAYAVVRGKNS